MEENVLATQGVPTGVPTVAPINSQGPFINQSPQAGVVGSVSPNQGGKPKKFIWIILVLLLLLVLGAGAYFLGSGGVPQLALTKIGKTLEETPVKMDTLATPTPFPQEVEGTQNWILYKKEGQFSFKYPTEAQIKEYEDGAIVVTQFGPTQKEGTEFYDGLSLSFRTFDPKGMSLKETADQKYLELKELFDTSQPQVASIAGESGYTFEVKGYVKGDYYYIRISDATYLEVINATKDPTNVGFIGASEKILTTLILGQ